MIVNVPEGFDNLQSIGKVEVIREMIGLLVQANLIPEILKEKVTQAIVEREALGTTSIMNGVAVPHCKCEGVEHIICCIGRSSKGVDFEALDSQPTFLFFLLVSPKSRPVEHLETLCKLSSTLRDSKTINHLRSAKDAADIALIMQDI